MKIKMESKQSLKESTKYMKDLIDAMSDNLTGLKLFRKDIVLCSSEDELLSTVNKYSKEYGRLVAPRMSELSGSLEDKQEQILDHIQAMKAYCTTELNKYNNELEIADSTFSELLKVVNNGPFNSIESNSSKHIIYFGTTIESQTELAEYFRKELSAKYYGTGYGGSWTAHNLLLPNGAEIKVGKLSTKIGVEIESVHTTRNLTESIHLGNDRSSDDSYTHYTFQYNGQRYSFQECNDNYKVAYHRNKDFINGIYPYDEAEHPWAYSNHDDTKWNIVMAGKKIDTIDSDDLEPVIQLLQKYDAEVESRIVHN